MPRKPKGFDAFDKLARSTARYGNPGQASRGAGVELAKRELGDAIDRRLELEAMAVEQRELELLAETIGCTVDEAKARLAVATLDELEVLMGRISGGLICPK